MWGMSPSDPSDFNVDLLKDVTTSRDFKLAHPVLVTRLKEAIEGYGRMFPYRQVIVTCTYRSPAEQQRLFAKGRFGNPGPIVTTVDGKQKLSKHNAYPARAVDLAISDGGKLLWDEAVFYPLGNLARECKLEWGGFWTKCLFCERRSAEAHKGVTDHAYRTFQDVPHFELPKDVR